MNLNWEYFNSKKLPGYVISNYHEVFFTQKKDKGKSEINICYTGWTLNRKVSSVNATSGGRNTLPWKEIVWLGWNTLITISKKLQWFNSMQISRGIPGVAAPIALKRLLQGRVYFTIDSNSFLDFRELQEIPCTPSHPNAIGNSKVFYFIEAIYNCNNPANLILKTNSTRSRSL